MKTLEQRVKAFEDESCASLQRFGFDVNMVGWTKARRLVASIITDQIFEIVLASLVLLSLGMVIIETDAEAQGDPSPGWIDTVETMLLFVYCGEMGSRIYVLRRQIFDSPLNILDFTVVLIDTIFFLFRVLSLPLPQVSFFRVLRLMRLTRAFHILQSQQELYIMVEGLLGSLKTTFFGCLFIGVALAIFGIIAVKFMKPMQVEFCAACSRGPTAWFSVYFAMCTLIQTIVVGDEWGDLFLPYLDTHPETLLFIVPTFVVINVALLNLIMAVIVDSASQARRKNSFEMAQEKEKEFQKNTIKLHKLCEDMDQDKSGSLTLDELLEGFDNQWEFRGTLRSMDLEKDDMKAVFNILDEDGSGTVAYSEFVEQLNKMKTNNVNTTLVFVKHYVTQMKTMLANEIVLLKQDVRGITDLNERSSEELALIRQDASLTSQALAEIRHASESSMKAFQDTAVHIEALYKLISEKKALEEERKPHTDTPPLHDQVVPAISPLTTVSPAMSRDSSTADPCFQSFAEQIAIALDDLRCKCEKSAALLSTIHGFLHSSVDGNSGMANCLGMAKNGPVDKCIQIMEDSPNDNGCLKHALDQSGLQGTDLDTCGGAADLILPRIGATSAEATNPKQSECLREAPPDLLESGHPSRTADYPIVDTLDFFECLNPSQDGSSLPDSGVPTRSQNDMGQTIDPIDPSSCLNYEFTFGDGTPRLGFELYWVPHGFPYVGKVVPDSPASDRGILPGDRLSKCNQVSIEGMHRQEVLKLLKSRPLLLRMFRNDGRQLF